MRRGSISSELLMSDEGVRSILLLPIMERCLETIYVCIWHMLIFMSVVMTVWKCLLCSGRCLSIGVFKYVVCLCKGCD